MRTLLWFAIVWLCLPTELLAEAKIKAAPIPSLEIYGALPAIDHMALSPSGRRFAFVSEQNGNRQLLVREIQGAALIAPKLGNVKVRNVRWAGENIVLISASATITNHNLHHGQPRHYEVANILIVNLLTKQISYVFQDMPDFLQLIWGDYGTRIVGGKWYGFYSSSDGGLYKVDLEAARTQHIGDETSFQTDWLIGVNGEIAARVTDNQGLHLWRLLSADAGATVKSSDADKEGNLELLGSGRTPGTALVRDRTSEGDLIEEYAISAGAKPTILSTDTDISRLLFDATSGLFLGFTADTAPKITVYDPILKSRLLGVMAAFPGLRVRPISYTGNFAQMIVLTDGGSDAGTYWYVDLTTGKANELSDQYPALSPEQVGPTRMVSYTASDGLRMEGVLTLPPHRPTQALPLVVMPHGGPIGVHDTLGFDWWAQAFASRGYAVFQPNFRGSSGYGRSFEQASHGEWGRKMQTDISDGVSALAAEGVVDPKRVCIVGASYGGYAALAGVTLQQDVYRCAVSVAGVSDLGELLAHRNTDRSNVGRYLKEQLGSGWAGDSSLAALSPLYQVDRAKVPILLIHGTDDTVVDPRQTDRMRRALEKSGKDVKFVPLQGDDHWLSRSETRTQMVVESVNFVLKNDPPD